jgi:hypothetical protein
MTYPVAGAGGAQVVEFVRVHNTIRLQARNTDVLAQGRHARGARRARPIRNSLLGAAPVASQPHPDRKSVLVEANGAVPQRHAGHRHAAAAPYRQGYSLDRAILGHHRGARQRPGADRRDADHWFTGSVSTQPRRWRAARRCRTHGAALAARHAQHAHRPAPVAGAAARAADAPRRADPRVGLFTTTRAGLQRRPRTHARAALRQPLAAGEEGPGGRAVRPVKPITFWIDRNVPLAYRETVRAAILEWNKAFETHRLRERAMVVQQQPDDAKFDTLDFGLPVGALADERRAPVSPPSAPAQWTRAAARSWTPTSPSKACSPRAALRTLRRCWPRRRRARRPMRCRLRSRPAGAAARARWRTPTGQWCRHADAMAEQAWPTRWTWTRRRRPRPRQPGGAAVRAGLREGQVMHEVGHALGLRHNFRASRAYTEAQLADAEFTRANGTTGSVMEYNAVNLPRPGAAVACRSTPRWGPTTTGPSNTPTSPAAGSTPQAEEAELLRIAARSSEPLLAYGTDEDAAWAWTPRR